MRFLVWPVKILSGAQARPATVGIIFVDVPRILGVGIPDHQRECSCSSLPVQIRAAENDTWKIH